MKVFRSALFIALVLFGCGQTPEPDEAARPESTDAPVQAASGLKRELDFAYGSMPDTNPLSPAHLPEFDPEVFIYEHRSFTDQLLAMINPESLRKYEGSYTVDEFRTEQEDRAPEYSLSSAWVIHNKQLPRAGIKVARNPATGRYEVNGGEVFLQESGLGVSYEKDEASGETKTFLNMKREF